MREIMFLHISWFLSIVVITVTSAASDTSTILKAPTISKSGCSAKCGNLTVPYPFGVGIGSGCGIGKWFELNCSTAHDPPRAFFGNIQVYEISDNQMRVSNVMAERCYDRSGAMVRQNTASMDITVTPFSYSSELNKFIVVGCDDFLLVSSEGDRSFMSGCVSLCSDVEDVVAGTGAGSCSGTGCCQTSTPKGMKFYMTRLVSFSNHSGVSSFNPCSYAFLGEESRFDFRGAADLSDKNFADRVAATVPIVLDWAIGNLTCAEAEGRNDYACEAKSHCVDSNTAYGGYRCRCKDGYEGNPYLDPGCTDIDECHSERSPCLPNAICTNLPGSYECSCPKGYFGNGTSGGFGCRRVPLSKMINLSIGLGVGIGSILVFSICFWLHKLFQRRANKKQKEKFFKRNGGLLLQQQTNESTMGKAKLFSAKELDKATDNFNENRILGQGGQGTVYKGMLSNGQIVAIKKSKQVDEDQLEQFINEVVILSQINHRNVVKLLGCCLETQVPLLVYEFVHNGTLFDLIHDPNTEFPVSWNMRLKIASDIAGALAYLHSACSLPIYHRDIKSSNILLDEKYVVKVSDFGTSKSLTVDQTHVTTLVKGTFGYLDPEYFQSSQFTEKSDVYSFGVVLVELLTGQRAISMNRIEEERSLATRFLVSMERNCVDEILDDQVLEQGKKEEVVAVARLAQRCLNLQGRMRPTMKEVAIELESVRMSRMPATLSVGDNGAQEARFDGAKMVMSSEFEYSWTTSWESGASSSSDSRPLKFETM